MPPASPKTHTPICPKCGYDQSGTIATWKDSCPLQGACPECGLNFDWFNIFNPNHFRLYWYAEHARNLSGLFKRTPPTILRLVLPHIFWKRVQIKAPVILSTLSMWSLLTLILVHLIASVVAAFGRWDWFYAYQFASIAELYQYQGMLGLVQLAFNSLFAPLFTISGADGGSLSFNLGTRFWEYADVLYMPALPALGAMSIWIVILTVIPTTRKLAKLRSAHIVRAGTLSLLSVLLFIEFIRVYLVIAPNFFITRGSLMEDKLFIVGAVLFVWQLVFWPAAIIIGWRIRPAALLVILGTIAAVLGGITLTLVIGLSF